MKNTLGFIYWVIIILISVMAVGLVGVAWYYQENREKNVISISPSQTLLVVETVGGLCFDEKANTGYGCNSTYTLYASGRYSLTSQINNEIRTINEGREGSVKQNQIEEFKKLIKTTNFSKLKNTPFTDDCPTAYDGSKINYIFYLTENITENIDTCEYEVDTNNKLISFANEISLNARPHTD